MVTHSSFPQPNRTGKENILVVDDEGHVPDAAERVLKPDYNLIIAKNSSDAKQKIIKYRGSLGLVIVDLAIPDRPLARVDVGNGYNLCAICHDNGLTFLVLTKLSDRLVDRERIPPRYCSGFLVKSETAPEDLLRVVRKALRSHK